MQFIQVLSDLGAGKRGSHHGVKWLCERHAIDKKLSLVFHNNYPSQILQPPAKYIDSLSAFFYDLLPSLSQQFQQPSFPVILSGDHSNAIGIISALCHAYPEKRIGVIWVDAHADLHTPYTTPSGNIHGMSLAALLRDDNLVNQHNAVSDEVKAYWQQLKNLAPNAKGIAPQDLCFLGVRELESEEIALLTQYEIPSFSVEQMREIGIEQVLAKVKQQFADVDLIYLSFDVDSLDSSLLLATGTPVAQGFNEEELHKVLAALIALPNLKAFELTEFNPTLCADNTQHERVYRLFAGALAEIAKRK